MFLWETGLEAGNQSTFRQLRNSRHILRISTNNTIHPMKDYLEKHKEEFKPWLEGNEQGRVDLKILPYLQDIENGFFVEAGALDGLFMSNTKILEDLGWKGLLIEPSPTAVEKCIQNRKSLVEQCALVSFDYPDPIAIGDFFFDGKDGLGAWSGIHRNAYGIKSSIAVSALTLDRILKHHKVTKVDFLSLDVEGYEMEVLKGIDFNDTDISHILVEVNIREYSLEDLNAYLRQFGYNKVINLSNFSSTTEGWDGSHQDFLYIK